MLRHIGFSVQNPRKAWAVTKAMNKYRKEHPVCEITGLSPVEVHHEKPVEYFPELAADPTNFISLYRRGGHLYFGHGGNWKWYVNNVRDVVRTVRITKPLNSI